MSSSIYEDHKTKKETTSHFSNKLYSSPLRERYKKEDAAKSKKNEEKKTSSSNKTVKKSGIKSFGMKGLAVPESSHFNTISKKYHNRLSSGNKSMLQSSGDKNLINTQDRPQSSRGYLNTSSMAENLNKLETASANSNRSFQKAGHNSTLKSVRSTKVLSRIKDDLKSSGKPLVVEYSSGAVHDIDISTALAVRENLEKISTLICPKRRGGASGFRSVDRKKSRDKLGSLTRSQFKKPNKNRLGSETRVDGAPTSQLSLIELTEKILNRAEKINKKEKARAHSDFPLKNKLKYLEEENRRVIQSYEIRIKDLERQLERKQKRRNTLQKMRKEEGPYTEDQKKFMIEDYENVLLILNEKHLDLKETYPEYANIADERQMETSQVLETMIDFLNKKNGPGQKLTKQSQSVDTLEYSVEMEDTNALNNTEIHFTPSRLLDDSMNDSCRITVTDTNEKESNSSPEKSIEVEKFE
ncbi:unnamed protein product [Moneuplotes crassus]|uniref:Uncharacterized protein n=2 Tax=Euplotes crassus TaxID=5936 RepID=A0AAD1UE35_EUPCR|nr:unnamed protein product [Moneuplotes crassus]